MNPKSAQYYYYLRIITTGLSGTLFIYVGRKNGGKDFSPIQSHLATGKTTARLSAWVYNDILDIIYFVTGYNCRERRETNLTMIDDRAHNMRLKVTRKNKIYNISRYNTEGDLFHVIWTKLYLTPSSYSIFFHNNKINYTPRFFIRSSYNFKRQPIIIIIFNILEQKILLKMSMLVNLATVN